MGMGGQLSLFEDIAAPPERRSRAEVVNDYEGFVAKFKPKLTTDDCYTPPAVYDAVADWVATEYGVSRERFVRPFFPGGDFEAFPYGPEDIVVDNPPFSILTHIARWYLAHDVRFFLFAPALMLLSTDVPVCAVGAGCEIEYENGAKVRTSFLTNLEDCRARSAPSLFKAVMDAQKKKSGPVLPKYRYPPNVLRATDLQRMSSHGVEYRVGHDEAEFVRVMDAQRTQGKSIFGAGLLVPDRLCVKRPAPDDDTIEWQLSARERRIVWGL